MTAEMSPATLPVVYVLYDDKETNAMHGLKFEPDLTKFRGDLSPLGENRTLNIKVDKYDADITSIKMELRSADGTRLIESTDIYDYTDEGDSLLATLQLKDLIESGTEYSLCVVLSFPDNKSARYYTRVIYDDSLRTTDMISFVSEFSSLTMNKDAARSLTTYLESDSTGDNSSFAHVDIHSSFDQITWGSLQPTRTTGAYIRILDMSGNIGSFKVNYRMSCGIDNKDTFYDITEYFRVRYSDERMYMLDYERTMNELFTGGKSSFANDKIMLGIHDPDVQIAENNAGDAIAFVTEGSLFTYRAASSRVARVFSFEDEKNDDERTRYDGHDIKVLSIDEGGNLRFLVYGYQNRGVHEGEICAVVYYYDSSLNSVEEEVSVPYAGSADMLEANLSKLSYVDRVGHFYLYIDGGVYLIDVARKSAELIASGIAFDEVASSGSGCISAYVANDEVGAGSDISIDDSASDITLLDMESGSSIDVEAPPGYSMRLLGFIGEDLVYGRMKATDNIISPLGVSFTPMSSICITGSDGTVKKEYAQPGVFISSVDISDSSIDISRIVPSDVGRGYEPIDNDQIMSGASERGISNRIIIASTEQRENITEIQLSNEISLSRLQLLTPDFALYEGSRSVEMARNDIVQTKGYPVYSGGDIEGIYTDSNTSLKKASEGSGLVLNMKNSYIWRKGSRDTKHIIAGLEDLSGGSQETALYDCLDALLAYAGSGISSREAMSDRINSKHLLEANIDGDVLALRDISLSDVLYYVSNDCPVIASSEHGPVLIVGYDTKNTLIYDPAEGSTHYFGMGDSAASFEAMDNEYLTFINE